MNGIGVILGILVSSTGLFFIFLYTNLMTMGYSFIEFVHFISKRFECMLFVLGIVLIVLSIERWRDNVLLLRRFIKFWK